MNVLRPIAQLTLCWGALSAQSAEAAELRTTDVTHRADDGTYEMISVAVVDATPRAMRHVVSRLCEYKDDMSHMSYCRVFKKVGVRTWSYAVIVPPVLDPRDYVVVSEVSQDLKPDGTGTYHVTWQLDPKEGPPPREGVVRLTYNEGAFTLRPVDGGRRTEVTYRIRCAPGGNIPARAAGYVQKVTLPDYVRLLERLAAEEERKQRVPAPVPGDPWSALTPSALDNPLPAPTSAPMLPAFMR